jgi:hypothetical protein
MMSISQASSMGSYLKTSNSNSRSSADSKDTTTASSATSGNNGSGGGAGGAIGDDEKEDYKEEKEEGEYDMSTLPAHACKYCGIHNPASVVKCNTCRYDMRTNSFHCFDHLNSMTHLTISR